MNNTRITGIRGSVYDQVDEYYKYFGTKFPGPLTLILGDEHKNQYDDSDDTTEKRLIIADMAISRFLGHCEDDNVNYTLVCGFTSINIDPVSKEWRLIISLWPTTNE
jgi:hypothetical protein